MVRRTVPPAPTTNPSVEEVKKAAFKLLVTEVESRSHLAKAADEINPKKSSRISDFFSMPILIKYTPFTPFCQRNRLMMARPSEVLASIWENSARVIASSGRKSFSCANIPCARAAAI